MDVILSYPFSGSLYAFFTEQARGEKIPVKSGHSYYDTLYGKSHAEMRDLALTQLLLYENVFIIPADNSMPELDNYESAEPGKYKNDKLGLYTDWSIHDELREEIEEQVIKDLNDPVISQILSKVPKYPKQQILKDSRYEIALANKYRCPILASGGRSNIIKRLSVIDNTCVPSNQVKSNVITATESYIDIVGLTFNPTNYDLLYEYKQDKEVRLYAKAFREIVSSIGNAKDIRVQLLMLMRESIEKQALTKKASGALDISSILLSLAGFIPVVGPFLSGGALLATGGSKVLDRYASRTWYEFGPRIKRITDLKAIETAIDKELATS